MEGLQVAYRDLKNPFTILFSMKDGHTAVCKESADSNMLLSERGVLRTGIPEMKTARSVFVRQLDTIDWRTHCNRNES